MTPIRLDEHRARRANLLRAMAPGTVAVVPGGQPARRNGDVDYPFRQDSDFWYLTGFGESGATLVLRRGKDDDEGDQAILFCQERNAKDELYNGERLGPDRAAEALGLDSAQPAAELDEQLPVLVGAASAIHCALGENAAFDQRLSGWLAEARAQRLRPNGEIRGLKPLLHELRLFKSTAEVELMRRAAAITVEGHLLAMRHCAPGGREADLEAELLYAFLRGGARSSAYPSIVASGANACVLHYTANTATLTAGDLVLIDAGCEVEHYAADLTRTFPVSGRFSPAQAALYEIVLEAQRQAIAACQPGAAFEAADEAALKVMVAGLERLGIDPSPTVNGTAEEDDNAKGDAKRPALCPHRTSHWLGLDVHDCSAAQSGGEPHALAPGMALTVEPGIYIPPQQEAVAAKWRGIGVRIEDDVLITAEGPEVLTDGAPKDIAEIERIMAETRG
ncbi:MAG: aminopeptidase P N-terminal domain-containing protein [Gammaproteobacteria bacterium]|nr:aminopeptidase P N-terminal domain-containing protein [Gammaproteobacteria bacterium]MDE0271994.1 aminopeptidase P N-terminal domain-containing protein [Gammaproteobacteria bacterium]